VLQLKLLEEFEAEANGHHQGSPAVSGFFSKVKDFFGVPPEHVVDVLGLMGDAVDNIPGAPGIGEKGARDLISRFGSLESLLANPDQVEKKTYRESLKENRQQILQSKELVTIDTQVPLEAGWEDVCDLLVFVDAPREVRLARLAARSGWSDADLAAREAAQWPAEKKLKRASAVIVNDGSREHVQEQVDRLLKAWGI
jgi:5'-3' exonuclease